MSSSDNGNRPSIRSIFGWGIALVVLIGWIPFLGPLATGFVVGRRAKQSTVASIVAAALAALLALVLYVASQRTVKIGSQEVTLGILNLFIVGDVAALVGGALIMTSPRPFRIAGLLFALGGAGWFGLKYQDVQDVLKLVNQSEVKYEPEKNLTCPDHLKKLYGALTNYAGSWDDTLPPANRWLSALRDPMQPFAEEQDVRCPSVAKNGYAMNSALGGKKLSKIRDMAKTPLIYDSSVLNADASDDVKSMPKHGRHTGRNNILYANGSVGQQ